METRIEELETALSNLRITKGKKILIDKRKLAIKIAFEFLGMPYIWGGDDPIKGFDCSGMIIEILKSVGILPRKGDWTADGLLIYFRKKGTWGASPYEGCLVFYLNNNDRAVHVEMCIDKELSIGASGGGSKTKTAADAIRQNAYVKIRPFCSKVGSLVFVDPFLE